MYNKNILTHGSKVSSVEQAYYSPVVVVPPDTETPLSSIYMFLGKTDPWPDDSDPPIPTQDPLSLKKIFNTIFAAKLITTNNISPVIKRVNWESGVVYDYYLDTIDIMAKDDYDNNVFNFYVKNKYDQVFKCLWNVNGSPSTSEPYFEPGSYSANKIYQGTDGYKWKYMYTIDTLSKLKFMDTTWIPVPVGYNTPNPIQTAAGAGNIDVINVLDGGSGYSTSNTITINVVNTLGGNTVQALATYSSITANGSISDIIVTNTGSNYTQANVVVMTAQSGVVPAVLQAPVSPVGGHGFDPVSELGCNHVMYAVEFDGTETSSAGTIMVPTDVTYHQIGILINPTSQKTYPNPANSAIYKTTYDITVSTGAGSYVFDEFVYQGTSLSAATFVGTVVSFDPALNLVKTINTSGTLTLNQSLFGSSSGVSRTVFANTSSDLILPSGYIAFVENRSAIQRSSDGIEQFKVVLGY